MSRTKKDLEDLILSAADGNVGILASPRFIDHKQLVISAGELCGGSMPVYLIAQGVTQMAFKDIMQVHSGVKIYSLDRLDICLDIKHKTKPLIIVDDLQLNTIENLATKIILKDEFLKGNINLILMAGTEDASELETYYLEGNPKVRSLAIRAGTHETDRPIHVSTWTDLLDDIAQFVDAASANLGTKIKEEGLSVAVMCASYPEANALLGEMKSYIKPYHDDVDIHICRKGVDKFGPKRKGYIEIFVSTEVMKPYLYIHPADVLFLTDKRVYTSFDRAGHTTIERGPWPRCIMYSLQNCIVENGAFVYGPSGFLETDPHEITKTFPLPLALRLIARGIDPLTADYPENEVPLYMNRLIDRFIDTGVAERYVKGAVYPPDAFVTPRCVIRKPEYLTKEILTFKSLCVRYYSKLARMGEQAYPLVLTLDSLRVSALADNIPYTYFAESDILNRTVQMCKYLHAMIEGDPLGFEAVIKKRELDAVYRALCDHCHGDLERIRSVLKPWVTPKGDTVEILDKRKTVMQLKAFILYANRGTYGTLHKDRDAISCGFSDDLLVARDSVIRKFFAAHEEEDTTMWDYVVFDCKSIRVRGEAMSLAKLATLYRKSDIVACVDYMSALGIHKSVTLVD